MRWCTNLLWLLLLMGLVTGATFAQVNNLSGIGGFESDLPSYWTKGSAPSGATLSWATDQSVSLGHSLKISKSATTDSAAWISTNMCDIWSPKILKNNDINLGAWVRTQGVNTNPTTDDQRWYIMYSFWDSAGAKIADIKLPVDQTTATSTGWLADTNDVGAAILPKDAWTLIVSFVGGANATGTVWADNFILYTRGDQPWLAGQDWNTSVGVPTGWYYWLPPNGGNDGLLQNGFENTVVTTEAAHTGLHSLKFDMPASHLAHDGFVGTTRYLFKDLGAGDPISEGDVLRISVWIKASNLVPDSAAKYPGTWSVGFTPLWFTGNDNHLGYSPVGPANDYTWVFPPVTSFDWTQYTLDVTVPSGVGAQALEVRLHIYAQFVGTIYFDDLKVEKLDVPQIAEIGGFEGDLPSYWTKGSAPSGATLSWATDQSVSLGHSLKISKSATTDSAAWISTNMCDIWSPKILKNNDINLGAWVRTQGVNTNPTTDDQRWYIMYSFWDSAGAKIADIKLPVDQTTATSTGWLADTNDVGAAILPKDAWTLIVSFVGGANATGTVWADNFILYTRGDQPWLAGQDWNTSVGVPTGWYYWLPPNGGNDGLLQNGFENTVVTTEAAHTGLHSLKFDMPASHLAHDGFVGTRRYLLSGVGPLGKTAGTQDIAALQDVSEGDVLRISVWIKASNLVPDSAAKYPGTWSVGFTPLWFTGNDNHLGYSPVGPANDYTWVFPPVTSFDWTQYTLDVTVPSGVGAQALEVRLHIYAQFVGTIYFDDLKVEKLDVPQIAEIGGFEGDLPSYWTKGSAPSGATLSWATDQSVSLGHSLKIAKPSTTADSAAWISTNMCDIWSPKILKNNDINLGAWVRTQGVNTNPTTDDQRWYIMYSFWDSAGAKIADIKLPVDQTTATSTGWLADTNDVGAAILPKDAWTLIVSFVGGANATGTVWADNFILYTRGDQPWLAGQDWNTSVGVPTGWYYWLPPNGGNDGLLQNGFENTVVTTEAAHTGLHSLKFDMPASHLAHDGFVGTRRYLLSGVGPLGKTTIAKTTAGIQDIAALTNAKEGDVLRISVWIKASNLVPDSAAKYPGTWSVGFTPLWFTGNDNHLGYSPVGPANDYTWAFPPVTSFDWTQYTLDVTVPSGVGAQALEVRLHIYAQFVGTIYFDDLKVEVIGTTLGVPLAGDGTPKTYELENNYPNPFNPSTVIRYGVPRSSNVSLIIYNILGQQVRNLVQADQPAGHYDVVWNGRDDAGQQVGSGMYLYRLAAGQIALTKKMLLLK